MLIMTIFSLYINWGFILSKEVNKVKNFLFRDEKSAPGGRVGGGSDEMAGLRAS